MQQFNSRTELDEILADEIASKLQYKILESGEASLLVSGGKTPINFFLNLSKKEIDWSKVTIGLVDERYVPISHEASNEQLVRSNLLINNATKAIFKSMIYDELDEVQNLKKANEAYTLFMVRNPICVLGMGEDGHTASLFPNDISSQEDLQHSVPRLISTISPNQPSHRISCSKALLLQCAEIYIMMNGELKLNVLNQAIEMKNPISYFIQPNHSSSHIFYSE